jgi:hypothetical protein
MRTRPTWQQGLWLTLWWILLFTLADSLFLMRWLEVSVGTYVSWYLALDYAELAIISVVIAHLISRTKIKQGPEGLV